MWRGWTGLWLEIIVEFIGTLCDHVADSKSAFY